MLYIIFEIHYNVSYIYRSVVNKSKRSGLYVLVTTLSIDLYNLCTCRSFIDMM